MTHPPISPDDLFQLSLVGDARISPDGTRVAYVVRRLDREANDYEGNIYLWENGESRQLTAGGKDSAPRWSPDGKRLAFLSGREEKGQIYLLPMTGGEPIRLTEQKLGAGAPVWSPDGRFIAFAGPVPTSEEPEEEKDGKKIPKTRVIERAVYKNDGQGFIDDRRTHIFVVQVPDGGKKAEVRQLTEGDCYDTSPAWSPDGEYLAFAADRDPDWDLRSASDIWIVSREGGTPRRVTDGRGVWGSPTFSPDGSRIAMVGYARPEDAVPTYYPQLWSISRTGGEPENLLRDTDLAVGNSMTGDWSIAGDGSPVWIEEGIVFPATVRGACNLYRAGDGVGAVTEGPHDVMDFSISDGGAIALTLSDPLCPAEIALQRGGRLERITRHNAGVLAERRLARPERVTFEGAEGEVDGWLMKPAGLVEGRRYPLIVYIHGGPVAAYGETFFHELQVLTGQGFGLFYCNPHGSSAYGQRFQTSIIGDWGNLDFSDVMAGAERAAREPWVDPHRLGVAGGSYGGFMVNWITGHTDRFAAACTQRSIANHISQGGTSDWAATRGERLGGTPEGDPDRLWERSPLKYVSQVKTPTLILHSERDDRCPIEEGEQWFMALRRQRVPARFVRFPEESHGLSRGGKPSRRLERLDHIIRWFKRWL